MVDGNLHIKSCQFAYVGLQFIIMHKHIKQMKRQSCGGGVNRKKRGEKITIKSKVLGMNSIKEREVPVILIMYHYAFKF